MLRARTVVVEAISWTLLRMKGEEGWWRDLSLRAYVLSMGTRWVVGVVIVVVGSSVIKCDKLGEFGMMARLQCVLL